MHRFKKKRVKLITQVQTRVKSNSDPKAQGISTLDGGAGGSKIARKPIPGTKSDPKIKRTQNLIKTDRDLHAMVLH